ncbi:hypothetical protein RDV89_03270 [Nocardioides zeae]|uniref:Uncharacterized protein n=1 Tax=Nocardioides imazamoxiresistens TaxID=3231893 RepID=A0ABU3PS95_9ACTN|nr:hypothetical protein [Nocardioides zeae]MDT9592069.1 hypothetical protein [Nocardioides zeae]
MTRPARPARPARTTVLALAAATFAAHLSACTVDGWGTPAAYPDATDLRRAAAAWTDPWLAPTEATTAGPTSGPDGLVRTVASRTTGHGPGAEALVVEVREAVTAGWTLHAVDCAAGTAYLVHGDPEDLDDLRVATVEVTGGGALVTGSVPHHRDGSWPDPGPPLDPADTCRGGGAGDGPPDLGGAAFDGDVARGSADPEQPRWDDDVADATRERVAAVAADPWVATLPELAVPDAGDDDWRRDAPATGGRLDAAGPDGAARLAKAVDDALATGDGWEVTYARCVPGDPGAPAAATLRRAEPLAVATLSAAGGDGEAVGGVDVALRLLPQGWEAGEGYADDVAALPALAAADVAACAGGSSPVVAGTPAVLPVQVWPSLG